MRAAYGTSQLGLWGLQTIPNLPPPQAVSSPPVTIAVRQVRDGRPNPEAIGNKPFGDIKLQPGVSLTEHVNRGVQLALERAGYKVIPFSKQGAEKPNVVCDVLIRDFWVAGVMTFAGYEYLGTVKLAVTFRKPAEEKVVWDQVVGKEYQVASMTASESHMEQALNEAFAAVLRELAREAGQPSVKDVARKS